MNSIAPNPAVRSFASPPKHHEEYLGAADVKLTPEDLGEIEEAASNIRSGRLVKDP